MYNPPEGHSQIYLTILEGEREMLAFLTDYVIFETDEIAY